jgi:phosphatidylserine decarboxylase
VKIDSAGLPFIAIAAAPALVSLWIGPAWLTGLFALLAAGVAMFFRDPERHSPQDPGLVLAPADGKVMYAGPVRPNEGPDGRWQQVTIFLSVLDVHINRTPVAGRVTRVEYLPGSFLPAYRAESWQNERSEIWIDHGGVPVVARQVVGLLARRVVCRVKVGDSLSVGARIGLMKFGSRMDVFVPETASLAIAAGSAVRAGVTVIARLRA